MGNALVTAFGTASSSATLPVTIKSLEEKNHIDPRISRCLESTSTLLYPQIGRCCNSYVSQNRRVSCKIYS